jgi:hypothetical protein
LFLQIFLQLTIFIPEENFTKIKLLDVVQVDAVVMFTTIELVIPLTSASQRHALGVTFPAPHGKHPTNVSSTFIKIMFDFIRK